MVPSFRSAVHASRFCSYMGYDTNNITHDNPVETEVNYVAECGLFTTQTENNNSNP